MVQTHFLFTGSSEKYQRTKTKTKGTSSK